ncbi:DMT family transporter [Massilia arenosa]|uniref:DMT family transporter n=1 Tax=Zemynaea arenosa TaxID=2561931 RepID=A0A4Y9SEZ2_9BURK|nr:DMT family transporter [Massilia arenosa]TFW19488.1 DMT family transporter [Massilia arenosa]
MNSAFLILSACAGMVLSVQAAANAQLSRALRNPFAATAAQLAIGALLLALAAAGVGGLPALGRAGEVPWWHLLGGLASALYVLTGIVLFPRIGAVTAVGLFIAGQMFASLAIDVLGVLGIARHAVSMGMVAGGLLVLAGVAAIVRGQTKRAPAGPGAGGAAVPMDKLVAGQGAGGAAVAMEKPVAGQSAASGTVRPMWVLLGLAAGAVLPVQGAINALLRAELGAPLAVGVISFAVAALAMAVVLVALLAAGKAPKPDCGGLKTLPWWGWLGGLAGAFYVTTVFVSMPVIGAATTVSLTVAGQQVASVFVDTYGWLRMPRQKLAPTRLAGIAVLLLGVVVLKAFG